MQAFCSKLREWVELHLPFTISCGIGSVVDIPQLLSKSYMEALEALQYKSMFGSNTTITFGDVITPPPGHVLQYAERIRVTAQAFRAGDAKWEEQLHELFADLKSAAIRRGDANDLIDYLIFALDKECRTLPLELRILWEQEALPEIRASIRGFIKIEETERPIVTILHRLSDTFKLQKNKKDSHKLILQIKQYIESHYDNPELSLNHISETFSLHMKTVSRLFKEEFGENFVDYVAKARVEEAKRLLVMDSPDSVQDIAHKVGYMHAITFIRVFKKWEGTTPGDYRKLNRES
jgi:YesN/AraC family two-component response regulator